MTPVEVLKRVAEIIGATAVVYAAAVGVIVACGGSVPPWATIAQAQTLEQSLKSFEAVQSQNDRALKSNIDLLTLERLRDDAKEASVRADAHPHDPTAQGDKWFAQKRLEVFFKSHPSLADAMGR